MEKFHHEIKQRKYYKHLKWLLKEIFPPWCRFSLKNRTVSAQQNQNTIIIIHKQDKSRMKLFSSISISLSFVWMGGCYMCLCYFSIFHCPTNLTGRYLLYLSGFWLYCCCCWVLLMLLILHGMSSWNYIIINVFIIIYRFFQFFHFVSRFWSFILFRLYIAWQSM